MVYDSIGTLFMNIGLFGGGLALAILGLVFGISRGMTKNSDMWAITFSAFAFLISLMIPATPWALLVFLMGGIGLCVSFIPIINKMGDSNIFTISIIFLITNLVLSLMANAYDESYDWQTNIDSINQDLNSILGTGYNSSSAGLPSHGLCSPEQRLNNPTECDLEKGSYNPLIFDVFASILAIGDYISKGAKLAGLAVMGPIMIGYYLSPDFLLINPIIYWLIIIGVFIIELALLYKAIQFVLNKRGMK